MDNVLKNLCNFGLLQTVFFNGQRFDKFRSEFIRTSHKICPEEDGIEPVETLANKIIICDKPNFLNI